MSKSLIIKILFVSTCFLVSAQAWASVLALPDTDAQSQQHTATDYFGNQIAIHSASYYTKQSEQYRNQVIASIHNGSADDNDENLQQLRENMLASDKANAAKKDKQPAKSTKQTMPSASLTEASPKSNVQTKKNIRPIYIPPPQQEHFFQTPTKQKQSQKNNDYSVTTLSDSHGNTHGNGFDVY